MDGLSFVFSLLLIFSVATITFGSVIKPKKLNGKSLEVPRSYPRDLFFDKAFKELDALLNRTHHQSNPDKKTDAQAKLQRQNGLKDQESKMSKRDDPENSGYPETSLPLLRENFGLKSDSATIEIEIENHSGRALKDLSTYFFQGTADVVPLPNDVHDGAKVQISYPQGGVDGVVVYFIEDLHLSLAIVYSVGVDENLWSVWTYPGRWRAKPWMYLVQLWVFSNVAGKDVNDKLLLCGLKYDGSMSTSAHATLKIDIK